jgi:hypothetical protein
MFEPFNLLVHRRFHPRAATASSDADVKRLALTANILSFALKRPDAANKLGLRTESSAPD